MPGRNRNFMRITRDVVQGQHTFTAHFGEWDELYNVLITCDGKHVDIDQAPDGTPIPTGHFYIGGVNGFDDDSEGPHRAVGEAKVYRAFSATDCRIMSRLFQRAATRLQQIEDTRRRRMKRERAKQ